MSTQGLQRAQQLLNVIGQQFPSIAQASQTSGVDLAQFIYGAVGKAGVPLDHLTGPFVTAVAALIGPPDGPPVTETPP